MESRAKEGGNGGKIQRRPLQRQALTPYQRPPKAESGIRRLEKAAGSGSGWLSKLVNPAVRFIAGSATRLFSSVFCKRPTAPDLDQEKTGQVRVGLPELLDEAPSELLYQAVVNDLNQSKNFGTYGVSEIEQLMKKMTYTRDEVDCLIRLIHSRTIEPLEPTVKDNKDKANASKDKNAVPQDVAASPTKIAKAYMSSRPLKFTYSGIGLPMQALQENKSFSSSGFLAVELHNQAIAPRCVARFSKSDRVLDASNHTPTRCLGRSAIYRMARSPYFNTDSSSVKITNKAASNTGFGSSKLTLGSSLKSNSKQGLKRRSVVFDCDHGSIRPIRRIRQRSDLFSGVKGTQLLTSSNSCGSQLQFGQPEVFRPAESKLHMKSVRREEAPSKLSTYVLNGKVFTNLGVVDKSLFMPESVNDTLPFSNEKISEMFRKILNEEQGIGEENDPSML